MVGNGNVLKTVWNLFNDILLLSAYVYNVSRSRMISAQGIFVADIDHTCRIVICIAYLNFQGDNHPVAMIEFYYC